MDSTLIEDDSFLQELRKEFLSEAAFLMEESEESFMKLENPDAREEELKKIFRLAHSLKGSGQAVGFADLSKFAHAVEDLLAVLRVSPHLLTVEVSTILLRSNDAFKQRIEMLQSNSQDPWDVESLHQQVAALTRQLEGQQQNPESAVVEAPKLSEAPKVYATPEDLMPSTTPAKPEQPAAKIYANPSDLMPEVAQTAVTPKIDEIAKSPVEFGAPSAPAGASKVQKAPVQNTASASTAGTTVKVDIQRIEDVLDLVGELVVVKSQMMHHESIRTNVDAQLNSIISLFDKTVRSLQDKTLSMRMTSLKPLFLKVQRVARDLSVKLNKPVIFEMAGEDTEIDRNMIETLTDPLIHLVRNSMDHGIESRERRAEAGKEVDGHVSLIASQMNGRVIIELHDDGGGIRRDKILDKAKKQGLIAESIHPENIPDAEVYQLLFHPGFSTAEKVTDVSGRGVGLDVVKSQVESIRGYVEIESKVGQGTCFKVSLPLTTAITDGMMLQVGKQIQILPMTGIREIVRADKDVITELVDGSQVIEIRKRFSPIIDLREILDKQALEFGGQNLPEVQNSKDLFVICEHRAVSYALKIDAVIGQTQVVVKSLGDNFDTKSGVSGGAILGDGQVALVIDLDGVIRQYISRPKRSSRNLESTTNKVVSSAARLR